MATHQENFHRMCLAGWLIGRFGIKSWVECGVLEGETVGYFSQFVPDSFGLGCDLNDQAVKIGQQRYPRIHLETANAVEWLRRIDPPRPSMFYMDTVWVADRLLHQQMEIVKQRWPEAIVFVNNLDMPGSLGQNLTKPAELQHYGRVIVPDYSMPRPVAAYGVIVPDDAELPPFSHWKVLPRS